ncbi:MAG: hypothetical protein L0Y80_00380 [Ignavibacteriae bacterium]|nr:hypothetical protein [Ignavibacteriota bacterium]
MKHIIFASGLILAAALSRLIPHPFNFTPIAAMALSSAVYLDKKYAFIIPLAAMLVSDAILGFHSGMIWVYGCFALIALMGLWLRSHKKPLFVAGAALTSSVLFFVVTNFAVWFMGSGALYPKTWEGLVACYVAAIPFFQNTVAGDLLYTGALFGLFELGARWFKVEQPQVVSVK